MTATAVWFNQRFADMIQYIFADPGAPTYANVARAAARGLEAGLTVRPLAPLAVRAGWTWLQTEVREAGAPGPGFEPGARLLRRPSHVWTVAAGWVAPDVGRFDLDAQWTGSRDDVDYREFPSRRVTLPAAAVVNVSVDLPVTTLLRGTRGSLAAMAITFRVSDVFDRAPETVVGFPGRGRLILAGLRFGS